MPWNTKIAILYGIRTISPGEYPPDNILSDNIPQDKIPPDKIPLVPISLVELNIKSLSLAGTDMSVASEPLRNMGAMFDSQLCMAPHVKSVVKRSSFHLSNIVKARHVLTEDATKTVLQSLVMSRFDYCNALLIGIQQDLISKLQGGLQNSAARIVSRTRKYEHITPVLIELHGLSIKFCIQLKVQLLVYKALNRLHLSTSRSC